MSTTPDIAARPEGLVPPWWCSTTTVTAQIHTLEVEPAADDRDPFQVASRLRVQPLGSIEIPTGSYLQRLELKAGGLLLLSIPLTEDYGPDPDDDDDTAARRRRRFPDLAELDTLELFVLGEVCYLAGAVLGRGLRALGRRMWPLD